MSNMLPWLLLGFAVLFNVAGNTLMKKATNEAASTPLAVFLSPIFLAGAVCFGLNLAAYTLSQRDLPLSVTYPTLVALSMLGILLTASLLFGERIGPLHLLGSTLIVVGVFLTVWSAQ